ncbi:lipid phosphate phosphatase 1 [Phellopilus nigrolimitatus]|nr:lipid phosphate phosphatase 1 [Phellopilus nigrolimitatus]
MSFSGVLDGLKSYYGSDALEWFDGSYIGDWLITTLLWFISGLIDRFTVFEREFSLEDPLIGHPHTKQQIGGHTNNVIAIALPLSFILFTSLSRRSIIDLHHGSLGLWVSRSLSHFITEFLKNRVGRLRPDFLARCKWGEALNQCTGTFNDILDGRKSFPSGHSSAAFSGMTYLFLWLSARTVAWSFGTPLPARNPFIFASRTGRISVTLVPLLFATWVAISRVEDYRHHKEDVIVGSMIGIVCGVIGYLSYWPNPFSHRHHANRIAAEPRMLYRSNDTEDVSNNGYELAHLEDGRGSA